MSITVHPAYRAGVGVSGGEDYVGARYLKWSYYDEPGLTPEQQARGQEAFAREFELLPPHREPTAGWGQTMARLCRLAARERRGLPAGERVPVRRRGQDLRAGLRQVS